MWRANSDKRARIHGFYLFGVNCFFVSFLRMNEKSPQKRQNKRRFVPVRPTLSILNENGECMNCNGDSVIRITPPPNGVKWAGDGHVSPCPDCTRTTSPSSAAALQIKSKAKIQCICGPTNLACSPPQGIVPLYAYRLDKDDAEALKLCADCRGVLTL